MKERIYIYDSTLRDGAQTGGINFSVRDKIKLSLILDELGVDYIEGGWPGANPTDTDFFNNLPELKNSRFSSFGMTRKGEKHNILDDLVRKNVESVCIVGKSWDFHLDLLNISEEENIKMIFDSISYLKSKEKEVLFDAEHFFDGFKSNKKFAIKCIKAAFNAGARWVVLCDTNGGSVPNEIYDIVSEIVKIIPKENIAIHCHNDSDCAVANSIEAVRAGARQVQGTINGIGERCGNANLISVIPDLIFKMGFDVGINKEKLKTLKKVSNSLDDLLNRSRDNFAPYVGKFAFAHKGGLHAAAISKNVKSYESIAPESVGNERRVIISDQSGRSNIISRLKDVGLNNDDDIKFSQISNLVERIKELENQGYSYDNADASFEILAKELLSVVPKYFELIGFRVLDELRDGYVNVISEATIKIKVDGEEISEVAEGNGPVNALDTALRKALSKKYPILEDVSLADYKVTILTPSEGTKAITRVQIESKDKSGLQWTTIGVSHNIVEASFKALEEGIIYKLMNHEK